MIYQVADVVYRVEFQVAPVRVQTLEGEVDCAAGDAVVTGVRGESWPVQRAVFFRKYFPTEGTAPGQNGKYKRSLAFVQARELKQNEEMVLTDGRGRLRGQPGDWALTYGLDDHSFIRSDVLAESYEPSKSVPVFIGIDRAMLADELSDLRALELDLRAALPHTPLFLVPEGGEDGVKSDLWFHIIQAGPQRLPGRSGASHGFPLSELVSSAGRESLLGQLRRLQERTILSFTIDRFRQLLGGFLSKSVEPGGVEEVAAQLVAVNEFNAALQNGLSSGFFIGAAPAALANEANDRMRLVGAVADALASDAQKKWQCAVLADTKSIADLNSAGVIAKPIAVLGLFIQACTSIVPLGILAALGLASFSELSEGCDASDFFAWSGCASEGWGRWVGLAAFVMYIGSLAVAWWRYAWAKVHRFESKHQDYRLLAECLRAQYVLSALGEGRSVADDLTAGEATESSWVRLVLRHLQSQESTATHLTPDSTLLNQWAMESFVNDQTKYHETTLIARRESASDVLTATGQYGAGLFLICLVLLTVNVVSKFIAHEEAVFSPMGQHLVLILQVAGLALWGSLRKVIDIFALEQEAQRGRTVLSFLKKATVSDRQSIVAAARFFSQDQLDWHTLHRSRPIEATTGGG